MTRPYTASAWDLKRGRLRGKGLRVQDFWTVLDYAAVCTALALVGWVILSIF